jgi:catechol 2,3-dioxygenase-like lactoylglutathione lyase family enzyme
LSIRLAANHRPEPPLLIKRRVQHPTTGGLVSAGSRVQAGSLVDTDGSEIMKQHIAAVSLVVPGYDEALDFYVGTLGFDLIEDTRLSVTKRWVLVAPKGATETRLLLAEAANDEQRAAIGRQTGGRVFLFLQTDHFHRDYEAFRSRGVRFLEPPRTEAYGTVAVFVDPFGNKWDLVEYA